MSKIYDALRRIEREREAGQPRTDGEPRPDAPPAAGEPIEALIEQATHALRIRAEVEQRVATEGVSGIDGLLEMAERLKSALGHVTVDELDRSLAAVARCAERLTVARTSFEQLQDLKRRVEAGRGS
jgi:hypothetical protein